MAGALVIIHRNTRIGGTTQIGETDSCLLYAPQKGYFTSTLAASAVCAAREDDGNQFSALSVNVSAVPMPVAPHMLPVPDDLLPTGSVLMGDDTDTYPGNVEGTVLEFRATTDNSIIGRFTLGNPTNMSDFLDDLVTWLNANGWTGAESVADLAEVADGTLGVRWLVADNLDFDSGDVEIRNLMLNRGRAYDENSVLSEIPGLIGTLCGDAGEELTANIGAGYAGFSFGLPKDYGFPVIIEWFKSTN